VILPYDKGVFPRFAQEEIMSVTTLDKPAEREAVLVDQPSTSSPPPKKLTVQEYLERERHSEIRHEFVEGDLFPMSGTTLNHNQIAFNFARALDTAFSERDCVVYMSDIRLRVASDRYRYPDVMALCGVAEVDEETPPCLLNPTLIVEVLSPFTAGVDRIEKQEEYLAIASVTDYLIVASDRVRVIHYSRNGNGTWLLTLDLKIGDTLTISALDVVIPVTDLYRKVTFAEVETTPQLV